MKKQLSILLCICMFLTSAVFTANAVDTPNEKISEELIEMINLSSPDEVLPVWISLKYAPNISEIEKYVRETYDIQPDDADTFLKYYRQEIAKFYDEVEQKFLNEHSVLIDKVLSTYSIGYITACVKAGNIEELANLTEVSNVSRFADEEEIIEPTDDETPIEPIFTPEELFEQAMKDRYGERFENTIHLGDVNNYCVYYNVPQMVCDWALEFTFGKYRFVESGGQTGNEIPEDLGVFIFDKDNYTVYNLLEAYENKDIDFDKVVSVIRDAQKLKDVWFTFGIKDVTEPAQSEAAATSATQLPTLKSVPKAITPKVKKANPMTVKTKQKTVKAKKLKKGKLTVTALTIKNAKGKLTYKKLSGSKKLTVTGKGKITIKKGTRKGTYKIKVIITAKGNDNYNTKKIIKTVKIKVK